MSICEGCGILFPAGYRNEMKEGKVMRAVKWKIGLLSLVLSAACTFNTFAEWKQAQDGSWKFYNTDGTLACNKWAKSGEAWFYFDENGTMAKDKLIDDNGIFYYVGADGKMITNTSVVVDSVTYYARNNGALSVSQTNESRADFRNCNWNSSGADIKPRYIMILGWMEHCTAVCIFLPKIFRRGLTI